MNMENRKMNDNEMNSEASPQNRTGFFTDSRLNDYWPLLALIVVSALAAFALDRAGAVAHPHSWMHYFMGMFLCIFSLLKLFTPAKFADGFQMYDLLAKKDRRYAYIYPLLELLLGLGYFSFMLGWLVNLAAIALFSFSAAGVVISLRNGLKLNCACMGNILKVPLSTVTLTEDIAMVLMALYMLFM
jgi:hypothetical protein